MDFITIVKDAALIRAIFLSIDDDKEDEQEEQEEETEEEKDAE